jgi:hypothetical protein
MWLFKIFRRPLRQVVINHLTRMERGYICVAGIDLATPQHLRLVLRRERLKTRLLARYGGLFDIGHIVAFRRCRHRPVPPHVEDYVITVPLVTFQAVADPAQYWEMLKNISKTSLKDIFGSSLQQFSASSCGTAPGQGEASLGCLRLKKRPDIYMGGKPGGPQIRMRLTDGALHVDAPVTDLRLYGEDHYSPLVSLVEEMQHKIRTSQGVILSVGLTRAFAVAPDQPPVHWLQVNNLHFQEQPVWRLG